MTYGWIILVGVAGFVILSQMGSFMQTPCESARTGFSQVVPMDWGVYAGNGIVVLNLENWGGDRVNVTSVLVSFEEFECWYGDSVIFDPGDRRVIVVNCSVGGSIPAHYGVGDCYVIDVEISYKPNVALNPIRSRGRLRGAVDDEIVIPTTSTSTTSTSSTSSTLSTIAPSISDCGTNASSVLMGDLVRLDLNATAGTYGISGALFELNSAVNYSQDYNVSGNFWKDLNTSSMSGPYSLRCWVFDSEGNYVYLNDSVFTVATTTTSTTTSPTTTSIPVGNDAAYISQDVDIVMSAGVNYQVRVEMENNGSTTWTEGEGYRLGSQNPQNNTNWNLSRAYLGPADSVAPGMGRNFSFNVTAPSVPGTYDFQWRMVKDGVEWFGEYSDNVGVSVCFGGNEACTLDPECCSGYCKPDYDGLGMWCAGEYECAHDAVVYSNASAAPECCNESADRFCDSGNWSCAACAAAVCSGVCGSGLDGCVWNSSSCALGLCGSASNDTDDNQSFCDGCMGTGYWSIGGETASAECCGDDSGEYRRTEDTYSMSIAFDNNEDACCNAGSDCVSGSTCYTAQSAGTTNSGLNAGGNDNYAHCYNHGGVGKWLDCDQADYMDYWCGNACGPKKGVISPRTGSADPNWNAVYAGEAGVGEYPDTSTYGCCGDDTGENYRSRLCTSGCTTDSTDEACCNSNTDCVYSNTCYASGACSGTLKCGSGSWTDHCSNGVTDCDETDEDCGGSCDPCSTADSTLMYVACSHNGDFDGRTGLDAFCSSHVPANIPTCTNIHAFVSVDSGDEVRDMPSNYGYDTSDDIYWWHESNTFCYYLAEANCRGAYRLATDWSDMLDGSVMVTQHQGSGVDDLTWTGTQIDGSAHMYTCGSWTCGPGGCPGRVGHPNQGGNWWMEYTQMDCIDSYCIRCICEAELDLLETEICNNAENDDGDIYENGYDSDCQTGGALSAGSNIDPWWTEWDDYGNSVDYYSGVYTCPAGYDLITVDFYQDLEIWDFFYIYDAGTGAQLYKGNGSHGDLTAGPFDISGVKFRLWSDASITYDGVKVTNITCSVMEPEDCCSALDDDGDLYENGYDSDCQGDVSLSAGVNDICWWSEWDDYGHNRNYYSGEYTCPSGYGFVSIDIYMDTEWWDYLYIYDADTGTQLYKDSGPVGATTLGPYKANSIKFRFTSDDSVVYDGVKVNSITCIPTPPENCCNAIDDDEDGYENALDSECRVDVTLGTGFNEVCWATQWDDYADNSDYYSGIYTCPAGYNLVTVDLYQNLETWDYIYIYNADTGTQLYKDGGTDGTKTVGPYNAQRIKFRFWSDSSIVYDGAKVNGITCEVPPSENCCNAVDDDGDGYENGYDSDCRGGASLSAGLNTICWWTDWDNYANNRDYYSGVYTCPAGYNHVTVELYQDMEDWDYIYIYNAATSAQLYKDGGRDGTKTVGPYAANSIKFRFWSDSSIVYDGVKVNSITCSV